MVVMVQSYKRVQLRSLTFPLLLCQEKNNKIPASYVMPVYSICTSLVIDKCSKIKKVGEPIVHRTSGTTQGAWMRDPLGVLGPEKIWYIDDYHRNRKVLEFESLDHFKAGQVAKTYSLPYIALMAQDLLFMDDTFTSTGLYKFFQSYMHGLEFFTCL